jgi:hypothetical protein
MLDNHTSTQTTLPIDSSSSVREYSGEVVYLFAFDVAYEMPRTPLRELLGQPVAQFSVDASKRSPRQLFFHKPQMVRMHPVQRVGPLGPVNVQFNIKLLPVGAISISVHVPFSVASIEDLVVYHDLQFSTGPLNSEVRQLAENIRTELASYFIRPVPQLAEEEAYTVFCIESPMSNGVGKIIPAESWLHANRRKIAALLTQESNPESLSHQESDESTMRHLSYYEQDVVVVDWDAALIVDDKKNFEETLYLMELANLQLAELEAYDRLLDDALDRAYRDLREAAWHQRRNVLGDLREIRIDMTRLSDELSNITKFFGDWHMARIYQNLATRFHLADWHRTIDEKLNTLDDLYQLLHHDQNNLWMLVLEIAIVLLFIIDVLIILYQGSATGVKP